MFVNELGMVKVKRMLIDAEISLGFSFESELGQK